MAGIERRQAGVTLEAIRVQEILETRGVVHRFRKGIGGEELQPFPSPLQAKLAGVVRRIRDGVDRNSIGVSFKPCISGQAIVGKDTERTSSVERLPVRQLIRTVFATRSTRIRTEVRIDGETKVRVAMIGIVARKQSVSLTADVCSSSQHGLADLIFHAQVVLFDILTAHIWQQLAELNDGEVLAEIDRRPRFGWDERKRIRE